MSGRKPKPPCGRRAKLDVAILDKNVDDWVAGRIDYDTFSERQHAAWRMLELFGRAEGVTCILRERFRTARHGGREK